MCANESFQMKYEFEDSNFSNQFQADEEQCDQSQPGELTHIKTAEGNTISVYLRTRNRLLLNSGKYFYIEYATSQTEHQKDYTGIVGTCHTCGAHIKGALKVSSNFICHLKNKHADVYQEFLRQKDEISTPYVRIPKKLSMSHRTSPYSPTTPVINSMLQNNEKQEQFQHNILQFLLATNQSFDVVEQPSFRKLFEHTDFPVQIGNGNDYEKVIKNATDYKRLEIFNIFNKSEVYACNTLDIWLYGGKEYVAMSTHWIDGHFQRQSALLACRKLESHDDLDIIKNEILLRYGLVPESIIANLTSNLQNFTKDFVKFGLTKNVLKDMQKSYLNEMPDSLEFITLDSKYGLQLAILKLNKIWGHNFVDHLNDNLKTIHKTAINKCSSIWLVGQSKEFAELFPSILNETMIKPNLFSLISLYTAIKQLMIHKDKLEHICSYLNTPPFSRACIEYLEELLDIFEPLNAAFTFLDMPQNHYYGCFLPTLITLKWKLTRLYNSKKLVLLQYSLALLKEELLQQFKSYYELHETTANAFLAALTYPPVKTRFLMGLKDNAASLNFQPRNILLKYGKEYLHLEDYKTHTNNSNEFKRQMSANTSTASDFFDFGDSTETVDAEELRDVNISKKEIAELMTELLSNLNEGISLESIELETPRKFLLSYQDDHLNTPNISPERLADHTDVSRQLDFNEEHQQDSLSQSCAITSSNVTQQDISFLPDVMSTPSTHHNEQQQENMALIPVAQPNQSLTNLNCSTVAIPANNLNTQVDLIALPIPGQPNCFQLAKVVNAADNSMVAKPSRASILPEKPRYQVPYETNYTAEYISVKRHAIAEYIEKFESLKNAQVNQISSTTSDCVPNASCSSPGFSSYQYDLLQQQMRIHVQTLTQTYVQTYCHPELWKLAKKPKELLMELQEKSKTNNNFKIWNLDKAINLITEWQEHLDEDTEENRELMKFLHREVEVTNHNTRQIPRFHSRILDCFLESEVFMYPQYLPRMPFSPKVLTYEVFSPVESYLIAMGLEKHMNLIMERKERVPHKSSPLSMACKRLSKDTLSGKHYRRVWDHIMHLKKVDYYNPIKYYFEHNKAPPVERTTIIGFANNTVMPLKDRVEELPLVFKSYMEKKNAAPKTKRKRIVTNPRVRASEKFRNSYLEFVREAVGEDISLPDNFAEASKPEASVTNDSEDSEQSYRRPSPKAKRRRLPHSLTINVNYVFGASPNNTSFVPSIASIGLPALPLPFSTANTTTSCNLSTSSITEESLANQSIRDLTINQCANSTILAIPNNHINESQSAAAESPVITYNFDLNTRTLKPSFQAPENLTQDDDTSYQTAAAELEVTEVEDCESIQRTDFEPNNSLNSSRVKDNKRARRRPIFAHITKLHKNTCKKATAYRDKLKIKQRCEHLITAYGIHLESIQERYQDVPIVQNCYRKFKALELYTNLLYSLKMICSKGTASAPSSSSTATVASNSSSPGSGVKRARNSHGEDDNSPSSQRMARKINRQEENFRHMLLPDTAEEANRKDAIYAFNFYEKVEEAFKSSNRPDDCKKFNTILKTFNPKTDKVSELYYKLEQLFLPDHPELAEVFLTFLLPSEAAEIGKFFEHFMINNMTTFINKLNIYFNKQPAQIRKIYNCLNELAEDSNVTMKKVETKIIPLLKGNQFLVDWFMQQFPKSIPAERLFSTPEHILNVNHQQTSRPSEHVETLADLMDSPTNDSQPQQICQLRYINGRIFYGSKMLLPAKLSFMANSYKDNRTNTQVSLSSTPNTACVHAIKDHGEKRLQSTSELANVVANNESNDDQDKSEEDDVSKALIIDTTAEEDESCSSFEPCDENTLKAHALRLNPSYYGSSCYSSNATSTPNLNSNFQSHHPNAKKVSLNFNDDASGSAVASATSGAGKTSPRKNSNQSLHVVNSPSVPSNQSPVNARDKRKSPSKKTKSPSNNSAARSVRLFSQPMVVIHETNSAIQCAKRLKSLVDAPTEEQSETVEEVLDSKEHLHIVARTKNSMKPGGNSAAPSISSTANKETDNSDNVKQENSDDLEFLPEDPSITHSPFPTLKMDTDSNEEDGVVSKGPSRVESDEDCKIEMVASLTTDTETSNKTAPAPLPLNSAWTRDEDKVILIEMKLGSHNREELYERIALKLAQRTMSEIKTRHQFLMDFLSKLQGK